MAAVSIIAVRLACTACGETVRLAAAQAGDLNAAGSKWINSHNAPEIVAVEAEHEGQVDEWVAL